MRKDEAAAAARTSISPESSGRRARTQSGLKLARSQVQSLCRASELHSEWERFLDRNLKVLLSATIFHLYNWPLFDPQKETEETCFALAEASKAFWEIGRVHPSRATK